MEQPIVQVPAELVMGPRCDLWADPDHLAAFERASTAAERMTARDSCMISARRNHRDAIHAWAEQTGRTWRQARALIPSRRPYLARRRKERNLMATRRTTEPATGLPPEIAGRPHDGTRP